MHQPSVLSLTLEVTVAEQPRSDAPADDPLRDPAEPMAVQVTPPAEPSMELPGHDATHPVTEPREGAQQPVIETLPPLDELVPGVPISPSTGQPRRARWMVAAMALLYAAAVVSAISLATVWWRAIHMETFMQSARLIELWQPRPGGWRSIVAVVALFAIGAAMTAACAVAGFNAWNGHRWSRWAALAAALVCCLGYLLNPIAWAAVPLALVGAALLWLPAVTRYFGHWERFRAGEVIVPRSTPDRVVYGPLPRFR